MVAVMAMDMVCPVVLLWVVVMVVVVVEEAEVQLSSGYMASAP